MTSSQDTLCFFFSTTVENNSQKDSALFFKAATILITFPSFSRLDFQGSQNSSTLVLRLLATLFYLTSLDYDAASTKT